MKIEELKFDEWKDGWCQTSFGLLYEASNYAQFRIVRQTYPTVIRKWTNLVVGIKGLKLDGKKIDGRIFDQSTSVEEIEERGNNEQERYAIWADDENAFLKRTFSELDLDTIKKYIEEFVSATEKVESFISEGETKD